MSGSRPLAEVLATMGQPRLVVVGDLILDRHLTGAVSRISPEAPIQILRVEGEQEGLGGAGSVATSAAVVGARTTLVGVHGADGAARRLVHRAKDAGLDLQAVLDPTRRTAVKTRHWARSHISVQQVLRVDEESVGALAEDAEAAVLEVLVRVLPEADAVLVSDYGKGVCSPRLLAWLTAAARERGIPVVVDPKGSDYARYRGATCLTPNRPETHLATGIEIREDDLSAAERAAEALVRDVDLSCVLVTLDREGMYLKVGDETGTHIPTTPREVFDVTGAGDTVIATFTVALASGATPEEAARLANVAAGIEVEHFGVVHVTRAEIADRLAAGSESVRPKAVERVRLPVLRDRLRAEGKRLVFTNGCFDVLHAGHVRFLQAARSQGDVLFVGLNADASVHRLKGAGRPVNAQEDRVAVLSALSSVDHVVVFEEDTPLALIQEVQPDVLVKGEDWRDKGVVGRDVVEARGGQVVLLGLLEGRSTTATIRRMADGAAGGATDA